MRVLSLVSILAWLLACHLHACRGKLYKIDYNMEIPLGKRESRRQIFARYLKCQHCLIICGGVSGVSVNKFGDFNVQFTIISSSLGFQRVQNHCNDSNFCLDLSPKELSSPAIMHEDYPKPMAHIAKKKESEYKLVCLAQSFSDATDECKTCLRQELDAKSLGEFLFVFEKEVYFSYVLSTSRYNPGSPTNCEKTGFCDELKHDKFRDDSCQHFSKIRVSKFGQTNKWVKKLSFWKSQKEKAQKRPMLSHCVEATPAAPTSKPNSLSRRERILDCMKCLEQFLTGLVHWMNVGAFFVPSAFFLITTKANNIKWDFCSDTCVSLKATSIANCHGFYQERLDTSSIGDQIFAKMEPEMPERENITPDYYSECVVAHYRFEQFEKCSDCLQSIFGVPAVWLSKISSLVSPRPNQKTSLTKCISTYYQSGCEKFVFVPNEMCVYERALVARMDRAPSAHRNPPVTKRMELRNYWWHQNHMSDDAIDSNPSGRQATVVFATYPDLNCLKCLALVHEVLMVSIEKSYVWMIEPKEGVRLCGCESINTKSMVKNPHTHSLRAISAIEVYAHIDDPRSWARKHPSDIPLDSLPKNFQWEEGMSGTR